MASVSGFSEAEESSKARKARQKVSMSNSEGSPQMEVDDTVDDKRKREGSPRIGKDVLVPAKQRRLAKVKDKVALENGLGDGNGQAKVDQVERPRPKALTAAERKAKSRAKQRANESADQAKARKAEHSAVKAAARANETVEQTAARRAEDQLRHIVARDNENTEQTAARRAGNRQHMAEVRDNENPEQGAARRAGNRQHMAEVRDNENPEQGAVRRAEDQGRHARTRNASVVVQAGDALRSNEILLGQVEVASLKDTVDAIGQMNLVCGNCHALRFKGETSNICCSNGKVQLDPFKVPPPKLYDLMKGDTPDSRLLLEHSRCLNNGLAMASLRSNTEGLPGFQPTVILGGRVHTLMGSLQPVEGESPMFAQTYLFVHDPALELSERFQNLSIPARTSLAQKNRLKHILGTAQEAIHEVNPYVKDFKQILELPEDSLQQATIAISAKQRPLGEHARIYNAQVNLNEVSLLTNAESHDLVIRLRDGTVQEIKGLNPVGMPLHFVLMFPYGDKGWDVTTQQTGGRRVTTMQFFSWHLQVRDGQQLNIHYWRKLFQEWICYAWFQIEDQRLNYQRLNQNALRADSYRNVREMVEDQRRALVPREDGLYQDDHQQPAVGRKILSSTFSGSKRWFNGKFQDCMAIIRKYQKPDLFITITCNPKWDEITEHLLPGQKAQDRPDIVSRVFKRKLDQLMAYLTKTGVLGPVVAWMYTVEWQKRGLPHAHILLIMAAEHRLTTAEMVDLAVCAELPPSPADAPDESAKKARERLEKIVVDHMVHGPCGKANPNCPCMVNGKCSKGFPKSFQPETVVNPENCTAVYRRRSPTQGGRSLVPQTGCYAGKQLDNKWIVPYCPFLSLLFECHINVEICASSLAAKYLNKYIHKGNSRAMVQVTGDSVGERDEIQEFIDCRAYGSSESAWHILGFQIAAHYPAVQALRVHLEEQQQIVFDEGTEDAALERARDTELTAFFSFNREQIELEPGVANMAMYCDMPEGHTYDKKGKVWQVRKRHTASPTIGRVHSVNPVAGDLFYLRILLHNDHCRGKTSFKDMLTIAATGKECETYQEVCRELGLLADDLEWQVVLEEAGLTQMTPLIRGLFVIMLLFCRLSNPRDLFDMFWEQWVDDFQHRGRQRGIDLDASQLQTMLLLDIELRLESHEKRLADFGLPTPTPEAMAAVQHVTRTEAAVIREELDFDTDELAARVEGTANTLNSDQDRVFQRVMGAVTNGDSLAIFVNARGGCGKTYLENAILDGVRAMEVEGCVALAMATTGIAATLLHGGRTYHSRLKAPLDPDEKSTLQISAQSSLAKLVRMAKILMIDEATMLDRFQLEALDRTLRDLMGAPTKVFGGKVLFMAGDFMQCLPVVPGATRAGTVRQCISKSPLWQHVEVMTLSENMRVMASGDPELQRFDNWLLDIGTGKEAAVSIPADMLTKINPDTQGQSMQNFCNEIFPNVETNLGVPGWLDGRAILASTNKEVDMINDHMVQRLPSQALIVSSADCLENSADLMRFNTEYLNTLNPNGFPRHKIPLKTGMPLMLLRNLSPKQGLCNGTRLVFRRIVDSKLLECNLVGSNEPVFIPRIVFIPKSGEFAFEWSRRQFPVRPAFSITINKSQGQTLKMAGIWLRTPVFTHGQLYVAASRVGKPSNLRFALLPEENLPQKFTADNVVFKEILLTSPSGSA